MLWFGIERTRTGTVYHLFQLFQIDQNIKFFTTTKKLCVLIRKMFFEITHIILKFTISLLIKLMYYHSALIEYYSFQVLQGNEPCQNYRDDHLSLKLRTFTMRNHHGQKGIPLSVHATNVLTTRI